MTYFLMILAGGITGLIFAGIAGAFLGVLAGLWIGAWHELKEAIVGDGSYSSTDSFPIDHINVVDGLLNRICNDDRMLSNSERLSEALSINPATGLPMTGVGIEGLDVGGNPFGIDLTSDDDFISTSSMDSMFDNDFDYL